MENKQPVFPEAPSENRRTGHGIRLGCGALIGAVLGIPWAIHELIASNSGLWTGFGLVIWVIACAFLSGRFGDRFYESLRRWLWWVWP
jgi:hypothetical protein